MTHRWDRVTPPAETPTAHLSDSELAAVQLPAAAEKHLADCGLCRTRRGTLSDAERDFLADLLTDLGTVSAPPETLEAAATLGLPDALTAALDSDAESWPDVAPAQLWRMSWRGQDALAVVLERNSWWVTVAPLSTDVDLADEYTLVCDADATSLTHPTAVFLRAAATVPQFTLSRFLGDVRPVGVERPATELQRLNLACIQSAEPPSTVSTGPTLAVDDWDRQEALDSLVHLMRWFEAATADVLDEDGAVVGGSRPQESDDAVNVVDLLKRTTADLPTLAESTGLQPARIVTLLQGSGKPSPEERAALGAHFGVTVAGGVTDTGRLALLEVLSEPANRNLWAQAGTATTSSQGNRSSEGWKREQNTAEGRGPGESVRPYIEDLLTHGLAARSVADATRGHADGGLEEWRAYWRDVLAHRRR
jgi:hypothetical protein